MRGERPYVHFVTPARDRRSFDEGRVRKRGGARPGAPEVRFRAIDIANLDRESEES